MSVFVLDKGKKPLMPCTGRRARLLLERGRAVVVRGQPFTISLKDRVGSDVQPIRVKIDPGGKMTGIALLANEDTNHHGQILRRTSQRFNVQTPTGVVQGINARHCKLIHRADGYRYQQGPRFLCWLAPAVSARG